MTPGFPSTGVAAIHRPPSTSERRRPDHPSHGAPPVSHTQGDRSDRRATPLYESRFEHDACGVGFVADAGGRGRDRVLPLALAGLAALGHRGAFGADGESDDGAGVALPLDRSVLELLAGDAAADRPGIVSLFLPRGRVAERDAHTLVERVLAESGLAVVAWRAVPV